MPSSFFPCIHSFMFHICMPFSLLFGLHGSLIQPLWLQSILIGCSTHLVFSKKHPYWMVLMPVYMETAEGLVKLLVILPATIMPLSSFILIFSWHHHPLCPSWFIPFSQPTLPPLYLTNLPHCYVWIPKESGHCQKWRVGGSEAHLADSYWLSYSRRYCRSGMQRRPKIEGARWLESGTDSDGLTETQGRGDLEMRWEGQIEQK